MKIDIDWRKYWGVLPIAVFLLVELIVTVIGGATNSELRSTPQMVLATYGVISTLILVFWAGWFLLWRNREQPSIGLRIARAIAGLVYCAIILATFIVGLFVGAFTYAPEHVVEKHGIKMVASVHSSLQETVDYYEYRNALFRGAEKIGWEDYGNGGGDPIENGQEPIREEFYDLD